MRKTLWWYILTAILILGFYILILWMQAHEVVISYPKQNVIQQDKLLEKSSKKRGTVELQPLITPTPISENREKRTGRASWYDQTNLLRPDLLGRIGRSFGVASPFYEKGTVLRIKNLDNGKEIRGIVVDWCQCYQGEKTERLVDLSKEAFSYLSDNRPELGLLTVEIKNEKTND